MTESSPLNTIPKVLIFALPPASAGQRDAF